MRYADECLLKWISCVFLLFFLSFHPCLLNHPLCLSHTLYTGTDCSVLWSRILNSRSSPICTQPNTSDCIQLICLLSSKLIKLTALVSIHVGEVTEILILPLALKCEEQLWIVKKTYSFPPFIIFQSKPRTWRFEVLFWCSRLYLMKLPYRGHSKVLRLHLSSLLTKWQFHLQYIHIRNSYLHRDYSFFSLWSCSYQTNPVWC